MTDELGRLAREDAAAAAAEVLAEWGVPWLRSDLVAMRDEIGALDRALAVPGAPPVDVMGMRLSVLVRPDDLPRLALAGPLARTAAAARDGSGCARALASATRPSEVAAVLRRAPDATAVAALAHGADAVRGWWGGLRDVAPAIDGDDLLRAGVPSGAALGRALDAVRDALLDEGPSDRDAQLALALRVAGRAASGEPPRAHRGRDRRARAGGVHHPARRRQHRWPRRAQPRRDHGRRPRRGAREPPGALRRTRVGRRSRHDGPPGPWGRGARRGRPVATGPVHGRARRVAGGGRVGHRPRRPRPRGARGGLPPGAPLAPGSADGRGRPCRLARARRRGARRRRGTARRRRPRGCRHRPGHRRRGLRGRSRGPRAIRGDLRGRDGSRTRRRPGGGRAHRPAPRRDPGLRDQLASMPAPAPTRGASYSFRRDGAACGRQAGVVWGVAE